MIEQIQELASKINDITKYRYGVKLLKHITNQDLKYIEEIVKVNHNEFKQDDITYAFVYGTIVNNNLYYIDENSFIPVYLNEIIELFEKFHDPVNISQIPNVVLNSLDITLNYLNSKPHVQQLELTDFMFLTDNQQIKNKLMLNYDIRFDNNLEVNIKDVSFLDKDEEEIEVHKDLIKIKKFDGVTFKTPQVFSSTACGENDKCKWYLVNSLLVNLLNKCLGNEDVDIDAGDECYYQVLIQLKG